MKSKNKNISEQDIELYKRNGWVIVRDVFDKKYVNKIKKELIKQTKKESDFFYYENINKKKEIEKNRKSH